MTDSHNATMPHTPDTVMRMVSGEGLYAKDYEAIRDQLIADQTETLSAELKRIMGDCAKVYPELFRPHRVPTWKLLARHLICPICLLALYFLLRDKNSPESGGIAP